MDLFTSMDISASGMRAQGTRLRVVAENLANKDSIADQPGLEPYRRRVVTFREVMDDDIGARLVEVSGVTPVPGEFELKYDPQHPAANEDGYVRTPNVNVMIELMDMREAQRGYEANLRTIQTAKRMINATLDILRR